MKEEVLKIIKKSDWVVVSEQDNIKMIQIQSGSRKLNIYWGTMTIAYKNQDGIMEYSRDIDLIELSKKLGIKKSWWQLIPGFKVFNDRRKVQSEFEKNGR